MDQNIDPQLIEYDLRAAAAAAQLRAAAEAAEAAAAAARDEAAAEAAQHTTESQLTGLTQNSEPTAETNTNDDANMAQASNNATISTAPRRKVVQDTQLLCPVCKVYMDRPARILGHIKVHVKKDRNGRRVEILTSAEKDILKDFHTWSVEKKSLRSSYTSEVVQRAEKTALKKQARERWIRIQATRKNGDRNYTGSDDEGGDEEEEDGSGDSDEDAELEEEDANGEDGEAEGESQGTLAEEEEEEE